MTFLELCQRVSKESGTISGTQPTTVVGQTGRLGKVVSWTAFAWHEIQELNQYWRWMQGEFAEQTIAGTQRYGGAAEWSITRFGAFRQTADAEDNNLSIYKTSLGVSDEGPLSYLDWEYFYQTQLRGSRANQRPYYWTIDPAGKLVFGPTPDDTYTIRGLYHKAPSALAENTDTPDMPSRHHMIIVWRALRLLAENDEAFANAASWNNQYLEMLDALVRDQLPRMRITAGPIA